MIDQAFERSKPLFSTLPKAKMEVQRVPEFKQATGPGAYYEGPAMDGTRPGIFYANLRDMNEVAKWGMPTLAYHEGVPGHHFQIATAQELKGLPQFRKLVPFTAYSEGWALYTEWLAKDAGWYEGDPLGDLGRLQAELFRAVRLVVDTGIHAQRWTREQAIAYMLRAHRDGREGGHVRDRALHRLARAGVRLQSRNAENPRAARTCADRSWAKNSTNANSTTSC